MSAPASPPKTSARRQGSSDRTSSAYDALRFLRTTNKWGEWFDENISKKFVSIFKIKIFYHQFVHHVFRIIMI
jgi:hypothetical protein